MISFATSSANAPDVIESLKKIFTWFRRFYAIYCDRDQHFDNFMIRNFLKFKDVSISYSLSDFSKSTDMMKVFNKLLKNVLRKSLENVDWDQVLNRVTKSVNSRVIKYLEMSSTEIIIDSIQKITLTISILLTLPERNVFNWVIELCTSITHAVKVWKYLRFRSDFHNYARTISQKHQEDMIFRYDRSVKSIDHQLQDLIMLHQKKTDKLEFRWRDLLRAYQGCTRLKP